MPTAAEISADATYAKLAALYDENCEPFNTLAQCDLFLRVATILRRRTPEEADHSGERVRTRDIDVAIQQARKSRAVLVMANRCPVVVVPGPLREGYSSGRVN